jgi:RNA polymerase sigma-70 factor (ECF subfamily)
MNAPIKDEDLIRQYLTTQPSDCFEALYNRYVNKVYRRCLSITQDSVKAQDFTHDIFIKAFAKLDHFQERSSFSTWLYSISHNYCMDQLRLSRRLNTVTLDDALEYDVADSDEAKTVEQVHQQLNRMLEVLSPEELTMLRLKYEDGLAIDDIAQQYQLKSSAVKMRLKRSRDKIQRLYNEQLG